MLSNYIVNHEDALFCFYHERDDGIMYRAYRNNRWSGARSVVGSARDKYSVTLAPDGTIYLFCQDLQGDIVLSTYKNHEWSSRVALKNQNNRIHTVILSPIITKKGLSIIYNMPPGEDRGSYLIMQQLSENGQWSPASRIDKFTEMNGTVYQVQHTSGEHLLLFYQTRTPETNLGYREITPTRQGGFNVFHTTNYYVHDTSFLTTNNGIHVLYVIKSMFSSQLIYRKKTGQPFGNPVVLHEGQRIDNCLLTIINDNLYATFMNGDHLYVCTSEDKGNTFSRPSRYMKKFCLNPVKATYLSAHAMQENSMFIRQVYVDKSCPWDIQLAPDLYDDFYMAPVRSDRTAKEHTPEPDSGSDGMGRFHVDGSAADFGDSDDDPGGFGILRNQLSMYQRQVKEKDIQLLRMTDLLKTKNEEIALVENQRKATSKRFADEIAELNGQLEEMTELKNRLKELEDENKMLKQQRDEQEH